MLKHRVSENMQRVICISNAMKFHGKSQSTTTINNAPIVQSFAGSLMDKAALERTKKV